MQTVRQNKMGLNDITTMANNGQLIKLILEVLKGNISSTDSREQVAKECIVKLQKN